MAGTFWLSFVSKAPFCYLELSSSNAASNNKVDEHCPNRDKHTKKKHTHSDDITVGDNTIHFGCEHEHLLWTDFQVYHSSEHLLVIYKHFDIDESNVFSTCKTIRQTTIYIIIYSIYRSIALCVVWNWLIVRILGSPCDANFTRILYPIATAQCSYP